MMTFEQFQATGRDIPDLAMVEHAASQGMSGPGRAYDDDLFIMGDAATGWCLTIENDSRIGALPNLEARLYEWACEEGYL